MLTIQDGSVCSQEAILQSLLEVTPLEGFLLGNDLVYVFTRK
jgi:hypothetical protein